MDLILGAYADRHLARLDDARLAQFEALVAVPDRDLYGWISGAQPVPEEHDNDIMAALKARPFFPAGPGRGDE